MAGVSPTARAAHGCAVLGNRMFIFGGLSSSGPLNDLFVLDTGRLWSSNILGGEKHYFPVCVCECVRRSTSFCWLTPDSLQWSLVDTHCTPSPRLDVAMCAVTLPGRHKDGGAQVLFVFGGVDTNGQLFDDCYVIHM